MRAEKNVFDYNEKDSYFQQIVRYGKHGHYHAHFDSETDKRTDKRCCQLYEDVVQAFNKDEGCRLCRWAYAKVQLMVMTNNQIVFFAFS